MLRGRRDHDVDNGDRIPADAPRVIRITPDGRREVDPMSIIRSERARKHLKDIQGLVERSRDSEDS